MNFIFLLQICSGISMEIYIENGENVSIFRDFWCNLCWTYFLSEYRLMLEG